ncbi:MAG: MBL fold metallo-hydrolase [Ignavibacteriaceae bacterium]|nr:MBL fold metallo-hydrolase [Ignavibacteriaceae bacterium]
MTAELIFTGTSSALAELNRFHSSFILQLNDYYLLMDAGDGISRALIAAGIPFSLISGVMISHRHADHWAGLPSLFTQWKLGRRSAPVSLFFHQTDDSAVKRLLADSYLFEDRFGFQAVYTPFLTGSEFSPADGISVLPLANSHLDKYKGYDVSGGGFYSGSFLITAGGKTLFYTGDIGGETDLMPAGETPDIYIAECSHVSADSFRSLAEKYEHTMIILTHYTSEQEPGLLALTREFPENRIILAKEGMTIELTTGTVYEKRSRINV